MRERERDRESIGEWGVVHRSVEKYREWVGLIPHTTHTEPAEIIDVDAELVGYGSDYEIITTIFGCLFIKLGDF